MQDLIRLLAERPEWRAQLRPLIPGDEFDRLPRIVAELAEAQRRTGQRLEELEQRVEELTARVDQLAARVDELVQAIGVMRADINRAHQRLDAELGSLYALWFERKACTFLGAWLRKPKVVTLSDLELVDEAEDAGKLDERELLELRALDLFIEGRDRSDPAQRPLLLAVEVSRTIDADDVSRALTRAKALEKAGYRAQAAVGGRAIDERARVLAEAAGVLVRVADDVAA